METVVVEVLSQPFFDSTIVEEFCYDTLYMCSEPVERQRLYDEFIQKHGSVFSPGVEAQLFSDLEAIEEGRVGPPLTESSTQPRELLVQLFQWPSTVQAKDCPVLQVASRFERIWLIQTLTHDSSRKIGDVVKQFYLNSADDEYLAAACLECLANRGYGEFLVDQLKVINPMEPETNDLHSSYLGAVSRSRDPIVLQKLRQIALSTTNDRYFMATLPSIETEEVVLQRARTILAGLPAETDRGEELLEMLRDRFPNDAKQIFISFLEPKSVSRVATMCNVLWYGHPDAREILSPFVDDERVKWRVRKTLRNSSNEN